MLGLWNEAEPWGETEGTRPGTGHMLGPTTALGRLEDRRGSWQVMEVVLCVPSPVTELSLLGLMGAKHIWAAVGQPRGAFVGIVYWVSCVCGSKHWYPSCPGTHVGCQCPMGWHIWPCSCLWHCMGTFQLSGEEHMENEWPDACFGHLCPPFWWFLLLLRSRVATEVQTETGNLPPVTQVSVWGARGLGHTLGQMGSCAFCQTVANIQTLWI